MKCIRCGTDSKYSDRSGGSCPSCHKKFAFEPKNGDPVTDALFQHAIERVSANGAVRFDADSLYYEVCRAKKAKAPKIGCFLFPALLLFAAVLLPVPLQVRALPAAGGLLTLALLVAGMRRSKTVPIDRTTFDTLLSRFRNAHGTPAGILEPKSEARAPRRKIAEDAADYSFDRAVICDRARTVDLLVANNFHFENNCAVLSMDGHPAPIFETVRTMLKRNPRLQVFALHDATAEGCALAFRLAHDPAWFQGHVPVVDVGLRPGQAGPFRGLLVPASVPVEAGAAITATEAAWLSRYALELAAVRPEQVLKRLYRAINRQESGGDGTSPGDGGGSVSTDHTSFSSDADASEGAGDGFG